MKATLLFVLLMVAVLIPVVWLLLIALRSIQTIGGAL